MSVSDKVRALLALQGKKNKDLAGYLDIHPTALQNKLTRNSFTADDLVRIATYAGASLIVRTDDGQEIMIELQDCRLVNKQNKASDE